MNLLKNKNLPVGQSRIAIIGGGPGGLTLARLLQMKGVDVKVYERDINGDVRIQGGALDLHTESGLAALDKAKLLDDFKANYRPGAEKVRVLDNQGKICLDEHTENTITTFGDKRHRPEIDRGPLRTILLNSLKPGTVVWNSHFVSLEPIEDTWKINFKNGDAIVADMVIGADGSNSKIRSYVTSIKPVWAGVTMIEGIVGNSEQTAPVIHQLLKGGKIFAFGNEKTLLVSSKGDGNLGFATGVKTHENWVQDSGIDFKDNMQMLAWFKQEFKEWGSIWEELFSNDKNLFIPRPQYCMPLDQHWEANSNIVLIGDAAHWMPPYAGEGVNMAMLDALQLSECLTNPMFKNTKAAIANYEKKMFKRFAKEGQGTLFNTRWMHEPKALENMLSFFGKNIFKKLPILSEMFFDGIFYPFVRKSMGLKPKQTI